MNRNEAKIIVGHTIESNTYVLWPEALEISWVFTILISVSLRGMKGGLVLGSCPNSGGGDRVTVYLFLCSCIGFVFQNHCGIITDTFIDFIAWLHLL